MEAQRSAQAESALRDSTAKVQLVCSAGSSGRELRCCGQAAAGEVLLSQVPAVLRRAPGNERAVLACGWCLCQLGSVAEQLQHLGVASPSAAAGVVAPSRAAPKPLPCPSCDEVVYCCAEHRRLHRPQHAALCSADPTHIAASRAFRAFATEECPEQLLAAEMVADSAARGTLPAEWVVEYDGAPWPDSAILPAGLAEAEERRARARYRADSRAGRELLLRALTAAGFAQAKPRGPWLTPSMWERMIGLVARNACPVTIECPMREHLEQMLGTVVKEAKQGDANAKTWLRQRPDLPAFGQQVLQAARRWKHAHGTAEDSSDSDTDDDEEQHPTEDGEETETGPGAAAQHDAGGSGDDEDQGEGELEKTDEGGEDEDEDEDENDEEQEEQEEEEEEAMSISPHSVLAPVASALARAYNALPNCEACAIYPAAGACITRSSDPNAELLWRQGTSRCEVVALRPLQDGEEVCIEEESNDDSEEEDDDGNEQIQHAEDQDEQEMAAEEEEEAEEIEVIEEPERAYGDLDYWRQRYSNASDAPPAGGDTAGTPAAPPRRKKKKRRLLEGETDETDEWLLSYVELGPIIRRALSSTPGGADGRVLDLGCGTSRFLADLRADGHRGELIGARNRGDVFAIRPEPVMATHFLGTIVLP
jgi:SAM-dependent methyltransferase